MVQSRRQHADDGVREAPLTTMPTRSTRAAGSAPEFPAPEAVAENHDAISSRPVLDDRSGANSRPSAGLPHPMSRKNSASMRAESYVAGRLGPAVDLRIAHVEKRDWDRGCGVAARTSSSSGTVGGTLTPRTVGPGSVDDGNQAIGGWERQRPAAAGPRSSEKMDGVGANAEGERQHSQQRLVPRLPAENIAAAVCPQVAKQGLRSRIIMRASRIPLLVCGACCRGDGAHSSPASSCVLSRDAVFPSPLGIS